ncbi:hypothetical protein SYNTR_0891 [Candidatus Syntrophocurvum alkaliphilum]|uniref:Uncharacterized protein n=1 Tax=Candidatus Syntrophocurvum alkaliphilum TaxID=2293317 RepID=A0A6I6DFW3_9FIRM|nr:hypothetical protein [Candidatus Syntrophocurvum alkaliphilum]QGT99484.1 hypothetical protein SYNTR_0891 [Candidatus Syntrophocurvum alkaliphilum]
MNIFENLQPKNLINSIPCFKSQYPDLLNLDNEYLKNQLLISEDNNNIIKLARGEGRRLILKSIINSPEIIFDWGQKSMHAFFESSEVREFLEPDVVNKEMLFRLLNLYEEEISYHCRKYLKNNKAESQEVIDKIREKIIDTDLYDDLLLIKEWLGFALHTGGNKKFSAISPWVSTSMGNNRYKNAYLYGVGNLRFPESINKIQNKAFVILDYWELVSEENHTYRNADYVRNELKRMGVNWYRNIHNEVMVKYALFPHQIIGYYYFENDELQYYFINHHYLREWKNNENFKIGDFVYINQANVDFPSSNPYRMIYLKQGSHFSIFNRR